MFLTVGLCILFGLVCLVISFEIYKKYDRGWQLLMKFPGPKPMIFFGTVLQVQANTEKLFTDDLVRAAKWPGIYKFPMLHVKTAICFNADDIEYLISGHGITVKSFFYDYLMPWLGTGLLTSSGDKWQTRRKLLTPAFHFNILQGFLTVFHEETKHLVKTLHRDCNADFLNVVPYISEFTLDSINGIMTLLYDMTTNMTGRLMVYTMHSDFLEATESAMSINFREIPKGLEYKKALSRLSELIIHRFLRPWLHNNYTYMISPSYWEEKKLLHTLHSFTDMVIRKREQRGLSTTSEEEDNEGSYATRKRLAMLDLLLSEKKNGLIDYEGIREEVDTFMFEGHDTVSMAICFSLLVLANYKTVQDGIREEIYNELGDNDTPSSDDLSRLSYMERCLKEILRLYPSVPFIMRTTIKEGKSPSGRIIPNDTIFLIQIYNLHRDPDVFPDPEKFDPDRFLPENCQGRHPFAYIPFSAGPRNCIGQKYAFLEMKAVLCGILREFYLESVHRREDIVLKADIVLKPNDDGIRVKFVPRNKSNLK